MTETTQPTELGAAFVSSRCRYCRGDIHLVTINGTEVWKHDNGCASCGVMNWAEPHPKIITLCGSTRFYDAFQEANYDLTMRGVIVLSVGFYPHAKAEHGHGEGVGHDSAEKVALDELHKRKIDLCDAVLVLNVGGYIGDSTRSEIEYAEAIGRPVLYLENDLSGSSTTETP